MLGATAPDSMDRQHVQGQCNVEEAAQLLTASKEAQKARKTQGPSFHEALPAKELQVPKITPRGVRGKSQKVTMGSSKALPSTSEYL